MTAGVYRVTFTRVGRHSSFRALETPADSPDDLALRVYRHVRHGLVSRDFEVFVDLGAMAGRILAGGRDAGRFTIEERTGGPS